MSLVHCIKFQTICLHPPSMRFHQTINYFTYDVIAKIKKQQTTYVFKFLSNLLINLGKGLDLRTAPNAQGIFLKLWSGLTTSGAQEEPGDTEIKSELIIYMANPLTLYCLSGLIV